MVAFYLIKNRGIDKRFKHQHSVRKSKLVVKVCERLFWNCGRWLYSDVVFVVDLLLSMRTVRKWLFANGNRSVIQLIMNHLLGHNLCQWKVGCARSVVYNRQTTRK